MTKQITKIFILALFFFINNTLFSIDIEKVRSKLQNLPDTTQIIELNKLASKYLRTDPSISQELYNESLKIALSSELDNYIPDIYRYIGNSLLYQSKFDEALKYYNKALDVSQEKSNNKEEANALKNIGIIYQLQGDFKTAILNYKQALKKFLSVNDDKGLASTYLALSGINFNLGNYSKALTYAHKSLKYYEAINDSSGMAKCFGTIGNIHADQENFLQALKYYNKTLETLKQIDDKFGIARTYANIGGIYNDMKQYKKAIDVFQEAIKIYKELDNKSGLAETYSNIGRSYERLGKYKKAINYFNNAIKLRKELDDKNGLIETYNFLADLYVANAEYNKALKMADTALVIAKKIGALPREKDVYNTLYKIYEKKKDYKNAFYYHQLFTQTKDSIFNLEKVKALDELETKYQVEKKEQELEKQRILLSKQEVQRNALIGVLFLMVMLALVIYLNLRQKKKSNILLAKQKSEIEAIHKELKSSILYAQRIQAASLASKAYLKAILSDYFIIFRPRDVVSGDFYWWRKVGNKLIITIADCTGHGVPGALMSMLGLSLLKEAIINEKIVSPKDILEFMRNGILDIFAQQEEYDTQDGMDMAIISIDIENYKIEFAGANNPIFIAREKNKPLIDESNEKVIKFEYSKCNLYEIKPDRMPIGKYSIMKPFTQVTISATSDDRIYLLTDGYTDQFGGPKNRKFTKKRLKDFLSDIFDKPISEQQDLLEKKLDKWVGDGKQTDDITLMGIRITKFSDNQQI